MNQNTIPCKAKTGKLNSSRLFIIAGLFLVSSIVLVGDAGPADAHSTRNNGSTCQAAIARTRAPIGAGWREQCSSPYWNWGVADPRNKTLYYNPRKIGSSRSRWDYVVAHERCHSTAPAGQFNNERAADRCASRYASTSQSPY